MSVLDLPFILALSLLTQIPGASSAWADNPVPQPTPARRVPSLNNAPLLQQPMQFTEGQDNLFASNGLLSQTLRPMSFDPASFASFSSPLSHASLPQLSPEEEEAAKQEKKIRKQAQLSVGKMGLEYFYGNGPIRKFNMNFAPSVLAELRMKPYTEQWAPCVFEIEYGSPNVQRYELAGCRFKGSVGSLRMCLHPTTGQPNGACRKLSWKVDANRYAVTGLGERRSDINFNGVKELAFGGLPVDMSLLTERLAAGLLKRAGIVGFRAGYAQLYINGMPDGIYSLPELPGDVFTYDRWGWDAEGGEGALYKETLFRNTSNELYFKEHRVSGKNEDDWMVEVTKAVLNAKTDAEKNYVVDTYFDKQSFIDVTAFNTVLGNTDDWRQRHNFLWYVLSTREALPTNFTSSGKPKKNKKLVLIPSDYDRINDDGSQRTRGPKFWYTPISPSECTQVDKTPEQRAAALPFAEREYWISLFSQYPPNVGKPINCDEFSQVMAVLAPQVNQRIVELATGILSEANVEMLMQAYSNQISHLPGQDPDPPNQMEWAIGKSSLREYLNTARANALADARAEIATGNVGASAGNFAPSFAFQGAISTQSTSFAAPVTPTPASLQSYFPPIMPSSWAPASSAVPASPSFVGFQPKSGKAGKSAPPPSPSLSFTYKPKEAVAGTPATLNFAYAPKQEVAQSPQLSARSFQPPAQQEQQQYQPQQQRTQSFSPNLSSSTFPLMSNPQGGNSNGLSGLGLLLGAAASKNQAATPPSGPVVAARSLQLPSTSSSPPVATNSWTPVGGATTFGFQPKTSG